MMTENISYIFDTDMINLVVKPGKSKTTMDEVGKVLYNRAAVGAVVVAEAIQTILRRESLICIIFSMRLRFFYTFI